MLLRLMSCLWAGLRRAGAQGTAGRNPSEPSEPSKRGRACRPELFRRPTPRPLARSLPPPPSFIRAPSHPPTLRDPGGAARPRPRTRNPGAPASSLCTEPWSLRPPRRPPPQNQAPPRPPKLRDNLRGSAATSSLTRRASPTRCWWKRTPRRPQGRCLQGRHPENATAAQCAPGSLSTCPTCSGTVFRTRSSSPLCVLCVGKPSSGPATWPATAPRTGWGAAGRTPVPCARADSETRGSWPSTAASTPGSAPSSVRTARGGSVREIPCRDTLGGSTRDRECWDCRGAPVRATG